MPCQDIGSKQLLNKKVTSVFFLTNLIKEKVRHVN